ncbi:MULTISPECIES: CocE/NonD family hydrolase [unclassified Nocardioides]|uniref:CocE/NonD family hydrolase n=1 Tax=unclassified Nocardioides TaxID=2615069 RepID=UPI00360F0E9F
MSPAPARVQKDLELRLSDGTVLRADVYRPADDAPSPVLLQRTPYDKALYGQLGAFYTDAGYTFAIQDVRGQHSSEGTFEPFVHEGSDGVEAVAWAAALPGTTGRVGMVGTSYQATCAWQAAVRQPPALAALACAVTPVDYHADWFFPGGAFALAFATTWLLHNVANTAAARLSDGPALSEGMNAAYDSLSERWYSYLPLRDFPPLLPDRTDVAPYFFSWINEHPLRDSYWQELSLRPRIADVTIPVLNVAGWYDVFVGAGADAFERLRSAGNTASRLVVGPWGHNTWATSLGDVDFGPDAGFSFPGAVVAWMDEHLRTPARSVGTSEPVRYFSMGDRSWRTATQWPPADSAPTSLHLAPAGRLNTVTAAPDVDEFVYDPANPVPSVGGHSCCFAPTSPIGPYDQREVERRPDVLVYSTGLLTAPVEIAGPVRVELYAASTATDTDFTAKLVDVHPDGRAINLGEGIVRARHRGGTDRAEPLVPGEVTRFDIELHPTANVFGAGHRIRLEISSSNFPAYDRNPNTGAAFGQDTRLRSARQTVHLGGEHASRLVLPVLGDLNGLG